MEAKKHLYDYVMRELERYFEITTFLFSKVGNILIIEGLLLTAASLIFPSFIYISEKTNSIYWLFIALAPCLLGLGIITYSIFLCVDFLHLKKYAVPSLSKKTQEGIKTLFKRENINEALVLQALLNNYLTAYNKNKIIEPNIKKSYGAIVSSLKMGIVLLVISFVVTFVIRVNL